MLYARYGNVSRPFLKKYREQYRFAAVFERLLNFRPPRYCGIDFMPPLRPRFMELCNPLRRFMEIIKQFPWSAIKIVEQNPFVFSAFTVRLSELAFLENNENEIVSFIGINIFKKQLSYNDKHNGF